MFREVDGYELKYTGQTTWEAKRYHRNKLIDIVPVTWTKDWHLNKETGEILLDVWLRKTNMEKYLHMKEPFIVVVAQAVDDNVTPRKCKHFNAMFEVVSTGKQLGHQHIQTRVLGRLKNANDY